MIAASAVSIAVAVACSFAAGSLTIVASVVLLWFVEFRREGDSFPVVWKYLGFRFFMLMSAIISVAIMPFSYRIVHMPKDARKESAASARECCSCPCDACKKCQRKNPDHANQ